MRRGLVFAALGAVVLLIVWFATRPDAPATRASHETRNPALPVVPGEPVHVRPRVVDSSGASIAGTVRDLDGKPLVGARVCAVVEPRGAPAPCDDTAADGTYLIAKAPLATTQVSAARERYQADRLDLPTLRANEARTGVDLTLALGVLLEGRVIDASGVPIEGARVTSMVTALTDTQGAFAFWVAPGTAYIEVSAEGYATVSQGVGAPGVAVFVLHQGSSITGRVVDDLTGAAVPDVRVTGAGEAVTDEDGRFVLDGLAPSSYFVEASSATGYARSGELAIGFADHREDVELRLRAAHQLSVRVRFEDGTRCDQPEAELDEWGMETGARWRDGDTLRFDGVPPGRYLLTAACGLGASVSLPVDVNATRTLEVTHSSMGRLLGRIRADGGTRHAKVWIRGPGGVEEVEFADHDGRFEQSLVPGTYELRAGRHAPETAVTRVDVKAARTATYDVRLAREPAGQLTVMVVDRDGAPVVGWVNYSDGSGPTNRDGRLDAQLSPGRYAIEVGTMAPSFTPVVREVEIVDGRKTVERVIIAEGLVEIEGIVVDETRNPVEGAAVAVAAPINHRTTHQLTTGADGRFVARVTRGAELTASRPGGGVSATEHAHASGALELVIADRSSISGSVVLTDGTIPTRFDVIVNAPGEYRTRNFRRTGGRFTIEDVAAGKIQLGAAINGLEVWRELEVAPGERRTGLEITLPAVASIAGRIVDATTREPIVGAKVNLTCSHGGAEIAFIHRDQRSGPDGRFVVRELPPGPCKLETIPPDKRWLTARHGTTVPLTATLDIGDVPLARAGR